MKKQYFNLLLLLSMVVLICNVFAGCDRKKKEEPVTVFQKIKVSTTSGTNLEINNPEIDYSDYSIPEDPIEEYESFGIRIQKKDETETILWETINHVEIAVKDKNVLLAKIKEVDGNSIEAELVPDSKDGLSGSFGSKSFKIRLKDVKAIDVLH